MAKKTSTSKTAAKKSSAKKDEEKKTTKKAAAKKSVKNTAKKATAAKKSTEKKKVTKQTGQKSNMAKRTKKATSNNAKDDTMSSAEARAKALSKIKGYSKKDLEHFREIIIEKRDEIIDQLQNLKDQMLDPSTGEYINENSPYSLHMAEQGTDAMEREKTFLYAQRENKFLGYLEDALKRIDAGTYGICIECIEEPKHLCPTCPLVPKARLEAVPHSQLCLPIKQKQEKR